MLTRREGVADLKGDAAPRGCWAGAGDGDSTRAGAGRSAGTSAYDGTGVGAGAGCHDWRPASSDPETREQNAGTGDGMRADADTSRGNGAGAHASACAGAGVPLPRPDEGRVDLVRPGPAIHEKKTKTKATERANTAPSVALPAGATPPENLPYPRPRWDQTPDLTDGPGHPAAPQPRAPESQASSVRATSTKVGTKTGLNPKATPWPAPCVDTPPARLLSEAEIQAWRQKGITIRNGVWPQHIREQQISSYKEFATIRDSVRQLTSDEPERLRGHMLYHFTDNLNSADAWNKGSSPSPSLLGIIRDIQREEAIHDFDLRVVHTSGKFLVWAGVDGCSRGASEGLLAPDADRYGPRVPIHRMQTVPEPIMAYARSRCGAADTVLPVERWETGAWTGQNTLMVPPPSTARHCLYEFMRACSLDPHHTSACIILPLVRPNNYGSLVKYFEYVQIFAQGTYGVHEDNATPWILLYKARAPVPWRNGYRCEGEEARPRAEHPPATHRAWANWRDAERDVDAVVRARQDLRRTMKEKRRAGGFAPRAEIPKSEHARHPVRTPAGITDDEVRKMLGPGGRMLPGDEASSAVEAGVYKLQGYAWLRRQGRRAAACLSQWKRRVDRKEYRKWQRAARHALHVARMYILDVQHRPALLFWNFPRHMQKQLALGWRDPIHHTPRESYQENYPTVHTPSVYTAVRELWLMGHVRLCDDVKVVNPLGAVIKDEDLDIWRPVLDATASLLNRSIDVRRSPQPLVPDYMAGIYDNCYVAGTDWGDGYYHGLLDPENRRYYGIYCPVYHVRGAFEGYPFGASESGTVFDLLVTEHEEATKQLPSFTGRRVDNSIETGNCDPTRPPIYRMHASGSVACTTLTFVDDNRTVGPSASAVDQAIQEQRVLARDQGIKYARKKYFSARQHDIPILACLLDTRTSHGGPKVSIKPDTRAKVLKALVKFRERYFTRKQAPRLEASKIVGLAVACSPAVHSGAATLRPLHDVLSGKAAGLSYGLDYGVVVPLPAAWWTSHMWWENLLRDPEFKGVSMKRHSAATIIYQFSDASGDMYGYARLNETAMHVDGMADTR